jgi:hypothetical protein
VRYNLLRNLCGQSYEFGSDGLALERRGRRRRRTAKEARRWRKGSTDLPSRINCGAVRCGATYRLIVIDNCDCIAILRLDTQVEAWKAVNEQQAIESTGCDMQKGRLESGGSIS